MWVARMLVDSRYVLCLAGGSSQSLGTGYKEAEQFDGSRRTARSLAVVVASRIRRTAGRTVVGACRSHSRTARSPTVVASRYRTASGCKQGA